MKEKIGWIYLTVNLVNGKIYVGLDSQRRGYYLGSGKVIKRAVKKYGKDNFIKYILEECSYHILYEREQYWIDELDATNPEVGYNLTDGGAGALGYRHTDEAKEKIRIASTGKTYIRSAEHREKISKAFKGRKHTEEFKERIRQLHKEGRYNNKYRMSRAENLSDEERKRRSDAQKGKKLSEETKRKIGDAFRGSNNPLYKDISGEEREYIVLKYKEGTQKKIIEQQTGYSLFVINRVLREEGVLVGVKKKNPNGVN